MGWILLGHQIHIQVMIFGLIRRGQRWYAGAYMIVTITEGCHTEEIRVGLIQGFIYRRCHGPRRVQMRPVGLHVCCPHGLEMIAVVNEENESQKYLSDSFLPPHISI